MQVKNVSARPHHVGDVVIAPGETKEIAKAYENAINKSELVPQVEEKAKPAAKAPAPAPAPAPAEAASETAAPVVTDAK